MKDDFDIFENECVEKIKQICYKLHTFPNDMSLKSYIKNKYGMLAVNLVKSLGNYIHNRPT